MCTQLLYLLHELTATDFFLTFTPRCPFAETRNWFWFDHYPTTCTVFISIYMCMSLVPTDTYFDPSIHYLIETHV